MLGTAGCRLLTCRLDHMVHGSFLLAFWLVQMWGPDSSKTSSVFSEECVNSNYQGASSFGGRVVGTFFCLPTEHREMQVATESLAAAALETGRTGIVLSEFRLSSSSSDLIEAFCSSNNFFLFCLVYSFVLSELVKSLISGTWTEYTVTKI